jgi:hypothetical protein
VNEKAAKQLRKVIFGNYAYHGPREYVGMFLNKRKPESMTVRLAPGTRHSDYRRAKEVLRNGS